MQKVDQNKPNSLFVAFCLHFDQTNSVNYNQSLPCELQERVCLFSIGAYSLGFQTCQVIKRATETIHGKKKYRAA